MAIPHSSGCTDRQARSRRAPDVMLPVVDPCPFCSIPAERIWIESEHAIAFGADAPAAEGHIVVVPKEHVPSIHALPMAAQKGVWALVSERSLLRHDFRSRC